LTVKIIQKKIFEQEKAGTSVLGSQTVETPFGTVKQPTFGIQVPQYFYIKQEKPRPMPPLKVR
jgi:hypothetical protein